MSGIEPFPDFDNDDATSPQEEPEGDIGQQPTGAVELESGSLPDPARG